MKNANLNKAHRVNSKYQNDDEQIEEWKIER